MNIKFILSTLMAGFCLMPCRATDITLLPDTTVMKNATATKSIELKTGNPEKKKPRQGNAARGFFILTETEELNPLLRRVPP